MNLIHSRRTLFLLAVVPGPACGQAIPRDHGTITIVVGAEATQPVPTLSNFKANTDVASLLFARLARLGKKLDTSAESEFEPELARRWSRPDSVTLVFELDPRARWHDGTPVTSRDVVWSLNRARDSTISPTYALLLRRIASVAADGPGRVVVKFRERYGEQMYDAVWHVAPLPAHLLDTIPPDRLATSTFVTHPVGSGPFRWSRAEPGQKLELVANADFFLGRPKLDRVVFLLIRNSEAQLNAILAGTADAFEGFLLQKDIGPIVSRPDLRIVTYPSYTISYLLFNERAPGDRSKPHPILSDPLVRRALTMAIDRPTLIRATFGPYAMPIHGPMGQATWIRREAPQSPAYDLAGAKALLAKAGWKDSDGDGVLDKNGMPLALSLSYPGSSIPRVALAEPIQQMLKQAGIRLELARVEGQVWFERRTKGEFDIDFSQISLDPTPSGLVQSWTCAGIGGNNVAGVCSSAFDSALARASTTAVGAQAAWNQAIGRLIEYAPAVFLYSPAQIAVVSTRYRNVSFRSEATWSDLWRWSVDPERRIARDGR
jgi:peptide/nickel transport system substrate-binding protein